MQFFDWRDEHTFEGKFWLPSAPENRVAGRVLIKGGAFPILSTLSPLLPDGHERPEYLLGSIRTGDVSLLGCALMVRDAPWSEVAPVPKEALPQLKELLNWLYGSKEDEEPPIIASQNPDVKQLGEVLANAQSLNMLLVERNLKSAYERSGARSRQFGEHLIKALAQAEKAAAVVSAYDGEHTLLDSADNLVKVSRGLHALMKTTAKDAELDEDKE